MTDRYDVDIRTCKGMRADLEDRAVARFSSDNPYIAGNFDQGRFPGQPADSMRIPVGTGLLETDRDAQDMSGLKEGKKKLAKRANEIYRSLCDELALKECFFYGFGAWSEFVEGKISESGFYERAKAEAEDIITKQNG